MKQFKRIKLTPLTDASSLNLKVASIRKGDLTTALPAEKHDEVMAKIYEAVSKIKGTIVMGGPVDGPKHVFSQVRLAKEKAKVHMFPEPNPVRLYYHSANKHLTNAMRYKAEFLKLPATAHADRAHAFSSLFADMADGITTLVRTMEGFMNQQLSDTETYQISGEPKTKGQIERMDFNTKVREVIPVICSVDFFAQYRQDYDNLSLLNTLRDDLTHLKRVDASNYTSYQALSKRLMDFDSIRASDSVFTFVNAISQGYFEEETTSATETPVRAKSQDSSSGRTP